MLSIECPYCPYVIDKICILCISDIKMYSEQVGRVRFCLNFRRFKETEEAFRMKKELQIWDNRYAFMKLNTLTKEGGIKEVVLYCLYQKAFDS